MNAHTQTRTKLLSRLAKVEGEYAVARDQERQITTHADQMSRGLRAIDREMRPKLTPKDLPEYLDRMAQRRRLDHLYAETSHG